MSIFKIKMITSPTDQIDIAIRFAFFLSCYLFITSALVMMMRILTGAGSPATAEDPVSIRTLNRIILNTVEQSIIFVGLYLPLFLSTETKISSQRILSLASLFIVGRILFALGYLIGSLTKISSFRSFGFAVNLIVNVLLASHYFGINLFEYIDQASKVIFK
jgi:uncharacterized MAPEG superfamily protein